VATHPTPGESLWGYDPSASRSPGFGIKGDRAKKTPSQNWLGVIHQGASTDSFFGNAAPGSGKFGKMMRRPKFSSNCDTRAVDRTRSSRHLVKKISSFAIFCDRCSEYAEGDNLYSDRISFVNPTKPESC
jgi:hypothetical protein